MVDAIDSAFGELGEVMPNFNLTGAGLWLDLTLLIIGIIVLAIIGGVITFFVYRSLKFNKKIIVFEKINSRWTPVKKDRACEIKLGKHGDTVFYLSKHRRPIPKPNYQTGIRTYWLARIGDELLNFDIEDIDERARIMKVKIPQEELALERIAIHESFDKRYEDKLEWFKKHLGTILSIMLVLIFGIVIWLWFDKVIALSGTASNWANDYQNLLRTQNNISQTFNQILNNLDNICSSSGFVK